MESTAAENWGAPPVVGQRHTRHPRRLQSEESRPHLDARHVHVLHHRPDSGAYAALTALPVAHLAWCLRLGSLEL